jgi:hypothetical protein
MPGGGSEAIILPALLGGAEAAALPAFLGAAVDAAAIGGIGSMLTGGDPIQGALLGGLTGGIGSQIFPQGLGSLFGSGSNAAIGGASEAISPALAAADPSLIASGAASAAAPAASGISKFLPYAGLAGGAMLLDNAMAPKTNGPPMRERPDAPKSMPLDRMTQEVDPNSYLNSGGNRSYFAPYSMQPSYFARGGHAKGGLACYANGGSSSASSSNIPVRGRGDGRSDSIPAMLSDGEFVISAPAVSALGNGSNDAGAKKLAKMQKTIMNKHYKGGKPKKAMGLGGYVH